MKNQLKQLLRTKLDGYKCASVVSLSNSSELKDVFLNCGWKLITFCLGLSKRKVNSRIRLYISFYKYLLRLYSTHGSTYVVCYLKASQLAVQKYLAGEPLTSLSQVFPSMCFPYLSNGLPRWIPPKDRLSIRRGNPKIVRLYLTLFGVYRVIRIPFKPDLGTILAPFSGSVEGLKALSTELGLTTPNLLRRFITSPPELESKC